MENWSFKNTYSLSLLTLAYIIGEIAHFLINTTAREVARDIHFGDKECFSNSTTENDNDTSKCSDIKEEEKCNSEENCFWSFSGMGYEYQILAGPAFIAMFSISGVLISVMSDKLRSSISRVVLVGIGAATFSTACLLMGFSQSYWQLVVLRMLISAGESVCRPMSSAMIADMFSPTSRGVANGVFSWGVYLGFGLAFVLGINVTQADILGYGWRSTYVVAGIPGIIVSALIFLSLRDPQRNGDMVETQQATAESVDMKVYVSKLWKSFSSPAFLLLLIAAMARQTAGFSWAYNTRLFFQNYYPNFNLGYWILLASCIGGSFGVFAGGFFSDRLVARLGLHSRLWLLSGCTLLASPLASITLYLDPPYSMGTLILYYLFAETWFAVLFTVIVEIVEPDVRATCIALFLFCMNLVGGNLPVIITPLKSYLDDYRFSLALVWPGFLLLSSVLFLVSSIPLCLMQRLRGREFTGTTNTNAIVESDNTGETSNENDNRSTQPLLAT